MPSETLEFTGWSLRGEAEAVRPGGSLARAFGAAPGDLARCLVGGRRKGAREVFVQEILRPAPGRVEARCPHFGACGGCALQHLAPERQLEMKARAHLEPLLAVAPDLVSLPPRPAPSPWYYRSKVELSFMGAPGEVALGFNRRGRFDRIVDVRECFIGPPENAAILEMVRTWARRHALPGWNPRAGEGLLRYLVVRHAFASRQWLATLVTSAPPEGFPVDDLARGLADLGAAGVIHAVQDSTAGAVRAERCTVLAGEDRIVERLGDQEFALSWRSFFQSNPPAFARMLDEAREWADPGPGERVLDLFCGVGSVGLALCRRGARLVGVESVPEAVADARRNARAAGVEAEFHAVAAEGWPDLSCDLLVLDPPRSGCHPRLLARLPAEGPARILYISCNPARLALEMEALGGTYRLARVRLYDFFPQTRHMEALCLLERR